MAEQPNFKAYDYLKTPTDTHDVPPAVNAVFVNDLDSPGKKTIIPMAATDDGVLLVVDASRRPEYALVHDKIDAKAVREKPPDEAAGSKLPLGCSRLLIDVRVYEPSAYAFFSIYVWSPLLEAYVFIDETGKVDENSRLVIDIDSPEDILVLPTDVSGTVSVAIAGV